MVSKIEEKKSVGRNGHVCESMEEYTVLPFRRTQADQQAGLMCSFPG
uniref:Uncharacterized protein n=1 Tax=Anguilla anguilla TaxID=7936 RepID=A0A0E9W5J1_ANGAN